MRIGHEDWPVRIRAIQMEHGESYLGVIDKEVDTHSLEGRYLPISSALKALNSQARLHNYFNREAYKKKTKKERYYPKA